MGGLSGLAVMYEDDCLLVLDKPAGLLCVPGRGADKQDCLSTRVQQRWPEALVVHRLDMSTSGLCLMARGAAMQSRMSSMFAQREVTKRYVAVVDGEMPAAADWSTVDLPIAADWPSRPRRIIDAQHGKPSVTRWRAISFDAAAAATRVELEPLTGRTHQLRVHMSALGHPILGDALYATPEVQARSARLLLHATQLAFIHPVTGLPVSVSSAAPF